MPPCGCPRPDQPHGVSAPRAAAVTFSEHIAPILYDNCVTCHRPGEAAPFPLISYEDVAKRATADRDGDEVAVHAAVARRARLRRLRRRAPADRRADRRPSREWVKQGMPRGNARSMPKLPSFTEGWQLGKPDLVLEMPEAFDVPADGPDIYRNFAIPTGTDRRQVGARGGVPPGHAAASCITRCFSLRGAAQWRS